MKPKIIFNDQGRFCKIPTTDCIFDSALSVKCLNQVHIRGCVEKGIRHANREIGKHDGNIGVMPDIAGVLLNCNCATELRITASELLVDCR
jgi:hypothetical protein